MRYDADRSSLLVVAHELKEEDRLSGVEDEQVVCSRTPGEDLTPSSNISQHWRTRLSIRVASVMILGVDPEDAMSDGDLDAAERRADAATPGPWKSYVEGRDHDSGDSFIRTGDPDLYISYGEWPEDQRRVNEQRRANDMDFIAAARHDVPRLIAEVRRLRKRLSELK